MFFSVVFHYSHKMVGAVCDQEQLLVSVLQSIKKLSEIWVAFYVFPHVFRNDFVHNWMGIPDGILVETQKLIFATMVVQDDLPAHL